MNWTFVTETLFAKYQLHNTAVGIAFFFVLCFIYVKFSLNSKDIAVIGKQLNGLQDDNRIIKADNKTILEKVTEHDYKFVTIDDKVNAIDKKVDEKVIHLQEKWRHYTSGKSKSSTEEEASTEAN